ncbi:UNVERIFIED_CONTAM: cytochrome b subunit of formate dehydrogenase [Brevibacillus sp. OAP136]
MVTGSSLGWGDGMFNAGDHVVFVLDGAVGVVLNVDGGRVQVLWEDHFVSWEKAELLRLLEEKQA